MNGVGRELKVFFSNVNRDVNDECNEWNGMKMVSGGRQGQNEEIRKDKNTKNNSRAPFIDHVAHHMIFNLQFRRSSLLFLLANRVLFARGLQQFEIV